MTARIQDYAISIPTTGSAGSATGSVASPVFVNGCEVISVWWDFSASAPATTDASLYETALGATLGAIDAKANSATDAVRFPRVSGFQDLAGADLAFATSYEITERYCIPAGGTFTAALAQCDALAAGAVCHVKVKRY